MDTVNETIQDQVIHHSATNIMRIEAGQRQGVLKMMKRLEKDLLKQLVELDPTEPKNTAHKMKRLQALLTQTKETIKTHNEAIKGTMEKELYDLAEMESAFTEGAFNAAVGAEVATVAISSNRLKALAGKSLVEGKFPKEWWDKQSAGLREKFSEEMRMGMNRGESLGELSKRLRDNVMPVSRRNADALVRTSAQTVIQEARRESYKEMTDLIKGYKYSATLDTRTSPYCRAADGAILNKDYSVASGPSFVKPPPNHWNCRSSLVPITKSWSELESLYKGTKKMDKIDKIPTKMRASMDGKVPVGTNYTDWLRGRPEAVQNDILGLPRAELFREGKIHDMGQLLDQSGSPLTIKELKSRIASGTLIEPITGKVYVNSLTKKGKELAKKVKDAEAAAASKKVAEEAEEVAKKAAAVKAAKEAEEKAKKAAADQAAKEAKAAADLKKAEAKAAKAEAEAAAKAKETALLQEEIQTKHEYIAAIEKGETPTPKQVKVWEDKATSIDKDYLEQVKQKNSWATEVETLNDFDKQGLLSSIEKTALDSMNEQSTGSWMVDKVAYKAALQEELMIQKQSLLGIKAIEKEMAGDVKIKAHLDKKVSPGLRNTEPKLYAEKLKKEYDLYQESLEDPHQTVLDFLIQKNPELYAAIETKVEMNGVGLEKWNKLSSKDKLAGFKELEAKTQIEIDNIQKLLKEHPEATAHHIKIYDGDLKEALGDYTPYEYLQILEKKVYEIKLDNLEMMASANPGSVDAAAWKELDKFKNAMGEDLNKIPLKEIWKTAEKHVKAQEKVFAIEAIAKQKIDDIAMADNELYKAVQTHFATYQKGDFKSLSSNDQLDIFEAISPEIKKDIAHLESVLATDADAMVLHKSMFSAEDFSDLFDNYTPKAYIEILEGELAVSKHLSFLKKASVEDSLEALAIKNVEKVHPDWKNLQVLEKNALLEKSYLKSVDEFNDGVTAKLNQQFKDTITAASASAEDAIPVPKPTPGVKATGIPKSALYKNLDQHISDDLDWDAVQLGNNKYNLLDAEGWKKFKPNMTSNLSEYKKSKIKGKNPTKTQQQAYDLLDSGAQETFDNELAAIMGEVGDGIPTPPIAKPVPPISEKTTGLDFNDFKKYGEKKGSNEGGFFESKENPSERWYFKFGDSEDIAQNEILAGKLYEKAGVSVPELVIVDWNGRKGVASRIIDGVKKDPAALKSGKYAKDIEENFMVDAFLGDWDVVGTGYDNMLMAGNRAVRIDVGGSLRYRAQGGVKSNSQWNGIVNEIEDMRNPGTNEYASEVFGKLTQEQMEIGAKKVLSITDDDIRELVYKFGPKAAAEQDEIIKVLIARKAYIAKKYPKAVPKKAALKKANPALKPGQTITAQEAQDIVDSRVNGVVIRTDTDAIEDNAVLIWTEKDIDGSLLTVSDCRLREAAQKKLEKLIKDTLPDTGSGAVSTMLAMDDLSDTMLTAMKGITQQARAGDVLRPVDITRSKRALDEYANRKKLIKKKIKENLLTNADLKTFENSYSHWLPIIEKTSNSDMVGEIFDFVDKKYWKDTLWARSPKFHLKYKELGAPTKKKAPEIVWTKTKGYTSRHAKKIVNGNATRTGNDVTGFMDMNCFETEFDGVRIRYYGSANPRAIAGTMEVTVNGKPLTGVDDIYSAMKRLGIDATRATAEYQEELYLIQLMYLRNDPTEFAGLMKGLDSVSAPAKRVEYLKTRYTTMVGKKAVNSSSYDPFGTREAFGHGRQINLRPDLDVDPQWNSFSKDYRIFHNMNFRTDVPTLERLKGVINGGGTMAPTTDKLRRGFTPVGGSPEEDMTTGGAAYFFGRIWTKHACDRKTPGTLVWKADVLKRTDAISYPHDYFGDVTPSVVNKGRRDRGGRESTIKGFKRYASNDNMNETIFKNSLSIYDNIDTIYVEPSGYAAVCRLFEKSLGSKNFPDGRKITSVIKKATYEL